MPSAFTDCPFDTNDIPTISFEDQTPWAGSAFADRTPDVPGCTVLERDHAHSLAWGSCRG